MWFQQKSVVAEKMLSFFTCPKCGHMGDIEYPNAEPPTDHSYCVFTCPCGFTISANNFSHLVEKIVWSIGGYG